MKKIDLVIYSAAVLIFLAGQPFLFDGNITAAITLMFLAAAVAGFNYLGVYRYLSVLLKKFTDSATKFLELIKKFIFDNKDNEGQKNFKSEKLLNKGVINKKTNVIRYESDIKASGLIEKIFTFNKNILLGILVILIVLIQFFVIMGKPLYSVLFAVFAIAVGLAFVMKKDTYYTIEFKYEMKKAAGLIAGLIIVLIGWIMLLANKRIFIFGFDISKLGLGGSQHMGFWVTFIGCVIAAYFLPDKNKNENEEETSYFPWVHSIKTRLISLAISAVSFLLAAFIMTYDNNVVMYYFLNFLSILSFIFAMPVTFRNFEIKNAALDTVIRFLALAIGLYLAYKGQKFFYAGSVAKAMWHFVAAAVLFVICFPINIIEKESQEKDKGPGIKIEMLFLFVITIIGVYLRVHEINIRPVGIENDEAGSIITIFEKFNKMMEYMLWRYSLYFYAYEPFIKWMPLSHLSIKMFGIIIGSLTIPAIYFIVRYMFNVNTAFIITVLFTFSKWHLHFSRSGHGTIMLPLTVIISLFFILRGLKEKNKWMMFIGGLAGGMCWHGYRSGQLITFGLIIFLIYKLISERNFMKKYCIPVSAFALGFWIFSGTVFQMWFVNKPLLVGRSNDVSVFSSDPNAPSNPFVGIVQNSQKVFLMFNHQGDSRQRNTGMQPYDKTLDFWTGLLFMLGFLYSMYYWRDNRFLLYILFFISIVSASIFSIEAPSGFRTFGAIPIVYFYAAIPVFLITRFLISRFNFKAGIILILLLFVPVIYLSTKENYDAYFKRWVGGMDEPSTLAGEFVGKYGKDYASMLVGNSLGYVGHPPFRIWTWGYKTGNTSNVVDAFPERMMEEKHKGFIYVISPLYSPLIPYLRKFYDGEVIEGKHVAFGKFFDAFVASGEGARKIKGLEAEYINTDGSTLKAVQKDVNFPENLKGSYTMKLKGAVYIPYSQFIVLKAETDSPNFSVVLDGREVLNPRKRIYSGRTHKGLHKISISAGKTDAIKSFALFYGPGTAGGYGEPFKKIESTNFHRINTINGLMGYYYSNPIFDGKAAHVQLDPMILCDGHVLSPPYSVKWKGKIKIQENGEYGFNINTNAPYVQIQIDGMRVFGRGENPVDKKRVDMEKSINLVSGFHNVYIEAQAPGFIIFNWKRPGKETSVVPAEVLFTEIDGNYDF